MSDYKVQTLIFDKSKHTEETAHDFLKKHGYKFKGFDIKKDTIRARQIGPSYIKKQGYTEFRTIPLGEDIKMTVAYKKGSLKGGKMSAKQLKGFINQSYEEKPKEEMNGFILDKELSNKTAKIYHNPQTGEAVVAHRGTKGARDWLNNLAYATGLYEKTSRYKRGKKAQESAEKKYGKQNISTVGHSQGAVLARKLGKDTKEIINVNPAYLGEKQGKNEVVIRSKKDIVSGLIPTASKKERNIEIQPEKKTNILKEHSPDILDRIDDEVMIGRGNGKLDLSKLKVSELKQLLDQYKEKHPEMKLRGYKTVPRQKVLDFIEKKKIDLSTLDLSNVKSLLPKSERPKSGWVQHVKEKAQEFDIPYACAVSDKRVKESYKKGVKKNIQMEITPVKDDKQKVLEALAEGIPKLTGEFEKVLEGLNKPMKKPISKESFKKLAEALRKKKEEKEQSKIIFDSGFNEPEPTPAPVNIEPVVNRIEEKVKALEAEGRRRGAVSYNPNGVLTDISFVSLMKKYGIGCLVAKIDERWPILGIYLFKNKKDSTILDRGKAPLAKFGNLLKNCIERGIDNIAIPLTLLFTKTGSGHANMLIFRPFQRIVERYEPHGEFYGNSLGDDESFNQQLKTLFEELLTPYIGQVRFKPPFSICPAGMTKGLQSLESEIKGLTSEGGGFCSMWSQFIAEMTFLNPEKSTKEIIKEVMDLSRSDPEYVKALIRGYVVESEKEIDTVFKQLKKTGFKFREAKQKYKEIKDDRETWTQWLLTSMFDLNKFSKAPPAYLPLENEVVEDKSDEFKLRETYYNLLKTLTIKDLEKLLSLFGYSIKGKTKESYIKGVISIIVNKKGLESIGLPVIDFTEFITEKAFNDEKVFKELRNRRVMYQFEEQKKKQLKENEKLRKENPEWYEDEE